MAQQVEVYQGGLFMAEVAAPPVGPIAEGRQCSTLAGAERALAEQAKAEEVWVLRKPGDSLATRLGRLQRELRDLAGLVRALEVQAGRQ